MNPRPPAGLQIPFDRVTYREGQLLASRDLQDDLRADARLRGLHTRYLHETWGVALGFPVAGFAGSTSVQVGPGYAVDGAARDLLLAETLDIPVPRTQQSADLILVIAYQEDPAFRAMPGVAAVCGSRGLDPRAERPVFAWRTLETLDLGPDVPLARVPVNLGALEASPDLAVRKNASRQIRPHIGFGVAPAGVNTTGAIFQIHVDTSDAGFSTAPRYFARLNAPGGIVLGMPAAWLGSISYIDRVAPDGFFFNVPLYPRKIGGATVTWLGVEPVTGCEPLPNLYFLFSLSGFFRTEFGFAAISQSVEAPQ
jgi:hypothetical protein